MSLGRVGLTQVTDALASLRAHGIRAAARKLKRFYLHSHERVYLTRGDLDAASRQPFGQRGLEVRLARSDDVSRFAAFPDLSPHTVRAWLAPDHYVVLALKDGVPAGYRCLSARVPPSLAPALHLTPDEVFSDILFVSPSLRRQGVNHELRAATGHLLRPLGFRRTWGCQSPFNHVIHEVTIRSTAGVSEYVGTLTRRSLLGRVRFSFAPTTPLSAARVAGAIHVLTAVLGRVRRVTLLANRVSVTAAPDSLESIGAQLGADIRVIAVTERHHQTEAFRGAFDRIAGDRPDAVIVLCDPMFLEHRRTLTHLAAAHRLPAVYEGAAFAAAGGLLACGEPTPGLSTLPDSLRRVVGAADPARLVVNLPTARRLNLSVPPTVLERADRILG